MGLIIGARYVRPTISDRIVDFGGRNPHVPIMLAATATAAITAAIVSITSGNSPHAHMEIYKYISKVLMVMGGGGLGSIAGFAGYDVDFRGDWKDPIAAGKAAGVASAVSAAVAVGANVILSMAP